jgi:hypothetical protein
MRLEKLNSKFQPYLAKETKFSPLVNLETKKYLNRNGMTVKVEIKNPELPLLCINI